MNNYNWYAEEQARNMRYYADLNKALRRPGKTVSRLMAEESAKTEQYQRFGIVNGTPGSTDDRAILSSIAQIEGYDISAEQRYEAYEALYWYTINNHEAGADVLGSVVAAQHKALYEINEK